MLRVWRNTFAQATVEAAIMIPVIFLLLLLLIQPGIFLYDLCVMNQAASETCRVLLTASDAEKSKICEPFARRRLSSIPQQDNFHMHSDGCSYEINFEGSESSEEVCVYIKNQFKPLPLIGFLSNIFGLLNSDNCFQIEVKASQLAHPSWTNNSPQGIDPNDWVGKWLK